MKKVIRVPITTTVDPETKAKLLKLSTEGNFGGIGRVIDNLVSNSKKEGLE